MKPGGLDCLSWPLPKGWRKWRQTNRSHPHLINGENPVSISFFKSIFAKQDLSTIDTEQISLLEFNSNHTLSDFERLCTLPPWETLPLTQRSIAFRRVHLVKYWSSVVACQIIAYQCTDCQTLINNEQVVDNWSSILVVHTVKHQSTSWQEAWVKFRGEVKSFPVWENAQKQS